MKLEGSKKGRKGKIVVVCYLQYFLSFTFRLESYSLCVLLVTVDDWIVGYVVVPNKQTTINGTKWLMKI